MGVDDHIVLSQIRVQRGGAGGHGLLYRHKGVVLLVFHLDKPGRLLAGNLVFSHHRRNVVPVEPHSGV